MAIKGKKKSRGSQARRRPSTAPRPVAAARRNEPWYRTTTGRLIAGTVLAVIAGLVIWAVVAAQSRSEDLAAEQDRLVDYTSEIRSILQLVRVPASEMTQAPTSAKDGIGSLEKDAVTWLSALTNAQQQIQGVPAPPGMDSINAAFLQSINTYAGAGRTYELAVKVDGDVLEEILARAGEQREQAGSQWQLATDLLDQERADADMSASDLPVPAEAIPGAAPSGSEGGENN
jgi:hypothetical protein